MRKHLFINLILVLCSTLLSGCASVTSSSSQSIAIETVSKNGESISGIDCKLSNDKGSWKVQTPEMITVQKSAGDLMVHCEKKGYEVGTVRAISRAGAGMWGNVILGGGVGAIVDHHKGTAYNYPSVITVVMGESNTLPKPKSKK